MAKSNIKERFLKAIGAEKENVVVKTAEEAQELREKGIDVQAYSFENDNYGFYKYQPEYTLEETNMMLQIKFLNSIKVIKYCIVFMAVVVAIGAIAAIVSGVQIGYAVNGVMDLFKKPSKLF